MISEYLSFCQYYEEESYQDFLLRYEGFGKEFYAVLKKKLPSIFEHLKFYKSTESSGKCVQDRAQTEDSYSIFDDTKISFAIQLDPESEIIGVWTFDVEFETGYWSENAVGEAIDFIDENF